VLNIGTIHQFHLKLLGVNLDNSLEQLADLLDTYFQNGGTLETQEETEEAERLLNIIFNRKVGECGS